MTILYNDILDQPAALDRLLKSESANIERIATTIRQLDPRFIMIAARGSSDNAARYGQYLFGAHNRLPVALATPSLFTIYKTPPRLKDALVLAVSQSGQSPDICAVIEEGRRQGALTIAMTNDTHSPLAALADACIDLHAGAERSIAASKTYTTSLLALAMLSAALSDEKELRLALEAVPAQISQTLVDAINVVAAAGEYRDTTACVTIGRGYNYATAFEIALKLKELTYILAEPYSSADFQHGPVALVQGGFLVLAVVPEGKTTRELIQFSRNLRSRGAQLAIISSSNRALSLGKNAFPLPRDVPEWLSPISAVVPGQLFALGLAQARGLDPDRPRGLSKVTRTR